MVLAKEWVPLALLADEVRKKVAQRLSSVSRPVELVVYGDDGEESKVLLQMARELAEVNNLFTVREESGEPGGSNVKPALGFRDQAGKDPGVRFFGAPSGYEFASLLEDMAELGTGQTQLSAPAIEQLATISQPVTIKVFTTPT